MHADYVVLDIETTGLKAGRDRITEIAAVKVVAGVPMARFSRLVRPYRRLDFEYLPREITDLTGITMEMLKTGHHIEEALKELQAFVGDMLILGHNLKRFDMGFLQTEMAYFFNSRFNNELIDSMDLARSVFSEKGGNSLQKLAKKLEVPAMGQAHRALADCLVTHEVYQRLAKMQG